MAKEKDDPSVFNVDKIRELIEMMKEHDLNEVDLRQSDKRIKLRRGGEPMMYAPQMAAAPAASGGSPAPAAEVDDSKFDYILSPTVGTFYSRPKPESPDFIKVGDEIGEDSIVCIVEAMKMFNEIPAGISGKVVACLVKNEQPVGVNDRLFKIVPH